MRFFQYYQTNNNLLNIVIWKYFFFRFRHKTLKIYTRQSCKMSSPEKGGSQLSGWQIASSPDSFCDFGRKLENLSMPAYSQWCYATDGRTRLHEPWTARWMPFTSLRENIHQAYLVFLIFGQRNKIGIALCNLPIKNWRATFWHPNPMN